MLFNSRYPAIILIGLALAAAGCRPESVCAPTSADSSTSLSEDTAAMSVYADYPASYNLLIDAAGRPIASAAAWEKRRPEILDTMLREVYGFAPPPPDRRFVVTRDEPGALGGKARLRQVDIILAHRGRELTLRLTLFLPAAAAGPVPVFLFLNNRAPSHIDPARQTASEFWSAEDGIARGYGMAALQLSDVDPDKHDDFKNGVHGLMDDSRDEASWATLRAWAWGASRCLDYLRADPGVDGDKVAVVGHSRGGKTALVAGATDPRFGMVIDNNSGCGGMALSRRALGETIGKINEVFPHWFCGNFFGYNGRDADLPFDQHFLVAAIAPRPVYHASAADDDWADPEGEFITMTLADPVYRLYGLGGIGDKQPAIDAPRLAKNMGYHIRPGGHGLLASDWARFMDFADQCWPGH